MYYEMPQKECEWYIFYGMAYAFFWNAFFWNAQKSKTIICGSVFVLKLITCFYKMPTIYVQFCAITYFSHFKNQVGKLKHIKKLRIKSRHLKKHVINIKSEKEPQMIFFDFAVFQKNAYAILSKYSENSEFRFKPIWLSYSKSLQGDLYHFAKHIRSFSKSKSPYSKFIRFSTKSLRPYGNVYGPKSIPSSISLNEWVL